MTATTIAAMALTRSSVPRRPAARSSSAATAPSASRIPGPATETRTASTDRTNGKGCAATEPGERYRRRVTGSSAAPEGSVVGAESASSKRGGAIRIQTAWTDQTSPTAVSHQV